MMRAETVLLSISAALLAVAPASAQRSDRPSLEDSFRIGNAQGALCQVQNRSNDPAISGMFDRAWTIVCRDAARPIGQVYAFREAGPEPARRLAAARDAEVRCNAEAPGQVEGLPGIMVSECQLATMPVGYRIYRHRAGRVTWYARGLAGYDSALQLALRTIVEDRIIDGAISVATTGLADPVAFARVQAGALDPALTLAEGYRRNNSGDYAEAAEFFTTLQQRLDEEGGRAAPDQARRMHEYTVNRALQKSNLGEFAEAEALFAQAAASDTRDRVQLRLRRNFEALHQLNRQKLDEALAVLARPVPPLEGPLSARPGLIEITPALAAEINSQSPAAKRLGGVQSASLTPDERAAILDAQALQLRGTILRLQGKPAEAQPLFRKAQADAVAIRDGRVTSIARLRAQIMAEAALAHEDQRDYAAAEKLLRDALEMLAASYPETSAMNGARARLAAYLVRRGQKDAAIALYREVVTSTAQSRGSMAGLANQLAPYFALLADLVPARPELAGDLFLATQTLVRPGVADTQAVLARELSTGSGEASRLFRQAVTLSRDIERGRIELARLSQIQNPPGEIAAQAADQRTDLDLLVQQQSLTLSQLAAYPQYRALSSQAMTLDDLRAALKPGEAYYKLAQVGRALYAVYADAQGTTAWKLPISATTLEAKVAGIRETISTVENGQRVTYPFDAKLARSLYLDLFDPIAQRMAGVDHLIFEPDGAMLQLPVNLLIASDDGVAAYTARTEDDTQDAFDMRGIQWLGRRHAVSTAVSARSFRDARQTPASAAKRQYLGFGQNAPADAALLRTAATRSIDNAGGLDCSWPLAEWNKPIAATELRQAAGLAGAGGAEIVTGRDFTDIAIRNRADLNDYRILHFATHGLVTAPRAQCPARPALLTSFGGAESDGLLSFREIYDLKIDADVVILSACDTAGQASRAATLEAGVTTGGGSALDGLVRAFIGAGGRSVIASHWPAPDDFKATERLIAGIFESGSGQSIAAALRAAETRLMDEAPTSHPYYWSGFAIVGDGAQQLLVKR